MNVVEKAPTADEHRPPYVSRLDSLISIPSIAQDHIVEEISAEVDVDAQVVRRLLATWSPRKSQA
jgi:hypothetical protein